MEIGIVKPINIEDEMKGAYLDYAMSVITARALPDVRDGLKPVQRRILYAMDELGLRHNSPYKKSARIVGEVLGKYHPHGDAPVYESMVRMAQDFSMRYMLVDGQGNFGSVDGDPPAAMRYTEARLARIAEEMLADIDKNTVDFIPNFDGSLKEPSVLPARLPNLLLNGSSGIAVGMATNIPPHNLKEIVDAITLIINRFAEALEGGIPFNVLWSRVQQTQLDSTQLAAALGQLTKPMAARVVEEAKKLSRQPTQDHKLQALLSVLDDIIAVHPDDLMAVVKGPDFPTAGIIVGEEGIKNAYATGHGRIVIRARAHTEDIRGGRSQIVVTELPFQVNKAALIEKIAELVRDRRIEGISELRDESDRQGMRIVVELKRDVQARQILNQLYKHTSMQTAFSINMLALVEGQPRILTLKMLLMQYVKYRREVITRRTEFELARARHRAHILEGLKIALDHLDEVIATIRRSPDADTARVALMKNFKLTEIQAQAILDMQLRRLAALERKKILDEYAEVLKLIAFLEDLLAKPAKILYVIRDELAELKEKYGDARRTRILAEEKAEFTEEDLIPDQEVTVVLTAKGYVKRLPADVYRVRRGARSANGAAKEDDAAQQVLLANMLDTLMLFTNRGRLFQVRVRDLPDTVRQARGLPLSNFIQLDEGEQVASIIPTRSPNEDDYFVLITRGGEIKRVASGEYSSSRSSGLIAMNLAAGDELGWVKLTTGKAEVVIATEQGQAIRFAEEEVRPTGRTSGGVRAIRLSDGDRVAGAALAQPRAELVVFSRLGFAKRTLLDDYPTQGRAGGGVRAANVTPKTGPLVAAYVARPGDNLVVTTIQGMVSRLPVDDVPKMSRTAQGSPIITLDKGDAIGAVSLLEGKAGPENGEVPVEGQSSGGGKAAQPGAGPRTPDLKAAAVREAERIMATPAPQAKKTKGKASATPQSPKPEKGPSTTPIKSPKETEEPVKRRESKDKKAKDTGQAAPRKAAASKKAVQPATAKTKASSVEKPAPKASAGQATVARPAEVKTARTVAPPSAAKPTSVRLVKKGGQEEKAEAAIGPALQPAFQGWLQVEDIGKASTTKKRTTATKSRPSAATKAGQSPARQSKRGPAKDEGKSPSLISSVASKLTGKKPPVRPRK